MRLKQLNPIVTKSNISFIIDSNAFQSNDAFAQSQKQLIGLVYANMCFYITFSSCRFARLPASQRFCWLALT